MKDLTCVGLTTLDILARPIDQLPDAQTPLLVENITLAAAGTAAGTAVIAATLGLDVALVSAVGADVNGGIVRTLLSSAGVADDHLQTLEGMPTSTSILTIRPDGERPVFHMMGASVMTALDDAAINTACNSRFFHVGGVGFPNLRTRDAIAALNTINANGTRITCDLIAPQEDTLDVLREMLPHIHLFMPSEAEVRSMLGDVQPEQALRTFINYGATHCIIKRGAAGSIGLIDGKIINLPARKIEPIDTTSCGDSYCAGMIAALCAGKSLEDAMHVATITASLVAQGLGTTGALEGMPQVELIAGEEH